VAKNSPPGRFLKTSLAAFLLVLFTFSITPRKILHDALARHADSSNSNFKTPHVTTNGFNCNCNSLVAESPFTDDSYSIDIIVPLIYLESHQIPTFRFHTLHDVFTPLRGPPSIA
jgi:hypothetical protein